MFFNQNILSKNEVNTGRQIEFDILKALAIIFMVLIHVFLYLPNACTGTIFFLVDSVFGGVLAAPMFMFAMGLGWAYTKHNTVHDFYKRGCYLLLLGFILSFLRAFLIVISILSTPDVDMSLLPVQGSILFIFVYYFLNPDILQFAGLAFLLWALFKKFNVDRKFIIILSVIFSILSLVFNSIPLDNMLVYNILHFFINTTYVGEPTSFPLFTWFIFPVAGYEFAMLLRRCKDKNKFYLRLMPIALICIIIFFILDFLTCGSMYFSSIAFYHVSIFGALHCIAIAIVCLGIYNFLSSYLPKKVTSFATVLSVHITEIYVFSWILIPCVLLPISAIGVDVDNTIGAFLMSLVVFVGSVLISMTYSQSKLKNKIKIL